MALLAGIELYLFTSLGIWTKGKNVCKGTNKNLSETPVLNQACKTLVRTTTTKKNQLKPSGIQKVKHCTERLSKRSKITY